MDWDGPHEVITTEEQEESFKTLNKSLTNPPIVALPMHNRSYMIDCNASQYAIGAVLLQQQNHDEPKEWATVGFFSKKLSTEQRNDSAT